MSSYIAYQSVMPDLLSLLQVDDTADAPFINSISGQLFNRWEFGVSGSSVLEFTTASATCDYFAVYGHNLTGVTVQLAQKIGASYSAFHVFTVTDDRVIFERFLPQTDTEWRITFSGLSGNEYITHMQLGLALQLNPLRKPFTPPAKSLNKDIINNESIDRHLLSKVVRPMPYEVLIPQTLVDPAWVDTHFEALADHINEKPFFFSWDDSREDVLLCWTTDNVEQPRYSRYLYQDFIIRARGWR